MGEKERMEGKTEGGGGRESLKEEGGRKRERERERERETHTHTHINRQTDRLTHRHTHT